MRLRFVVILLLGCSSVFLAAQNPNGNYNPYVNEGVISPSPLWPLEADGKGTISFNIGNTGSDALEVFTDQYITLTITLSHGIPDHVNPISAISGSYADLFSWSYNSGTYTGLQTGTIQASSSGTIEIAYSVAQNSPPPGTNGFNVNIAPAPYQTTSNTQNDDAVSSYTYTEIRDYGDAPSNYGSADHIMDFQNYLGSACDGEELYQASSDADADDNTGQDDEDGVVFPTLIQQGSLIDISVTVTGLGRLNAWIDWNGDGDFNDSEERIASNDIRFNGSEDLPVSVPEGAHTSAPTYARFRFTPGTLHSSTGSAEGGEVEDYRVSIEASSQAPSVPTGLEISSYSYNHVSLSWNASTDNVGVTGYRIYRGGTLLGESSNISYTDNAVVDGNFYSYTVSAFNAAGYESDQSSSVSVTIDDVTPPSIPGDLKVNSVTGSEINLSWDASSDNVGVAGYSLFRDGSELTTTTDLQYTDNTVVAGNTYSYSISAFDEAGNTSGESPEVRVDATDPEILVMSISVSSSGGVIELINGGTLQYYAAVLPEDATNNEVTWSVTNTSGQASITQEGLLTALSEGDVLVEATAKDGSGITGSMHVTITRLYIEITSILIYPAFHQDTYFVGGSYRFTAEILPDDATDKHVEWSVENQSGSGTITQDGIFNAESEGLVTIMAAAMDGSEVTGSMQISLVKAETLISSLEVYSISGKTEVGVGESLQFGVHLQPESVDLYDVQWSVDNSSGVVQIN